MIWYSPVAGSLLLFYDGFWVETISGEVGPMGATGPQGVQGDTGPTGAAGATGATGPAATAPLTLTQSSNNANYPLTISSANTTGGGPGYSDILKLVNSKSGATNINKHFRLTDSGSLEIVNSAYTATILSLGDDGALLAVASVNGATIGDTGWNTVSSFTNGFSSVATVAYRKINNVVYLRGNLTGGTANTGAFVLPSGYRPIANATFAVQQFGTASINYVTIGSDGVVLMNGTSGWLTGVVFPAN
jgi:hypothetical protein